MLRFFEPELVSSASNRLRFEIGRNDAVLPLLSSSLLANNFASNVSPGIERLNGSLLMSSSTQGCDTFQSKNTLFSSTPSINPLPAGQATPMASTDHAMDMSKYNAQTDARKQRRVRTTDQPTSARESKRQKASTCNANKQRNASPIDESSQQQLMGAQGAAKKSQKLGDKITALQQMVSPFGKTDTASVLQEAGVCIKVLHEQIRVLSTPYFGLQPPPALPGSAGMELGLRERGLCVVPITSTIEKLSNREPIDSFVLERLGWGAGIRHH
ncbi:transcription factor bHLH112-like [Iris pallida]|uniref:Transcription factor bHLH112-like n=1 Tax=Iris pallida TaxID=29817 RepID=A0AAX6H0W0_IRIPA|nr:transcription factor bHLH112-like [Iris pallida]